MTNRSTQLPIDHHLAKAIAADPKKFVFVLGAGTTLGAIAGTDAAAYASWPGLIRQGLHTAADFGHLESDDADRLLALLDSNNPELWIRAAQQLSDALGAPSGGEFARWLRETVGTFDQNIVDRSVLDPLCGLAKLGVTLATVNYDGVLEAVTGQRAVPWTDRGNVERVLRDETRGILHFHGHWEVPESIVLGTSSYDAVVRDEHTRTALEAVRMLRTFVFIGHGAGLDDPNWSSFLDWTQRVFWCSETHHYRIASEQELAEVKDPRNRARRLVLVPYKGDYSNLGPFLQELEGRVRTEISCPSEVAGDQPATVKGNFAGPTPESKSPSAVPELPVIGLDDEHEYVLLLLNIGERGYDFVTREKVAKYGRVAGISVTHEVQQILDLRKADARQWRQIARCIDRLVADAKQTAEEVNRSVCFVVAGAAPLPAFSYLGYKLKRTTGQILFVNHREGAHWDRVGPFSDPSDFPALGRQRFDFLRPRKINPDGNLAVLHVGCSSQYPCGDTDVDVLVKAQGRTKGGFYSVRTKDDHLRLPLEADDLTALFERTNEALGQIVEDLPTYEHLALAFGGPAWMAFWLGRRMRKNVQGAIEFPNFVPGRRYVPALASQMWRKVRVAGKPSVLLITAEPHDHARSRPGATHDVVVPAVEREQGSAARGQIHYIGAMRIGELQRELHRARPDIIHISAHGGSDEANDGRLALEDERGRLRVIQSGTLVAMLRAANVQPSLIVISACYSNELAHALAEISDCVITCIGKVPYQSTVPFCRGLYGSLARGESVAVAFEQGVQTAKAEFDDGKNHFQIDPKDVADDIVFWERPRQD